MVKRLTAGSRDPQVANVDACRIEPRDHGALHHAGCPGSVSRHHDVSALWQERPVRLCNAQCQFRGDVDSHQTGDTRLSEQRASAGGLPDERGAQRGRGLNPLVRVYVHIGVDMRAVPDERLAADHDTRVDHCAGAHIDSAAQDRTRDRRLLADERLVPKHRVSDTGIATDHAVVANDGVVAHNRTGANGDVLSDHDLLAQGGGGIDLRALRNPQVLSRMDARDEDHRETIEDVAVHLKVALLAPDVAPVAVDHGAVDRVALLHELGEELGREVVGSSFGNLVEHPWLDHVDACVDLVAEDLAPRGLLQEAFDLAFVIGDDDAELQGIVYRLESDRDRSPLGLVHLDQLAQVDVGHRVSADDDERLIGGDQLSGILHRSGGAQWGLLDRVVDPHVPLVAVPEVVLDHLGHEREGGDHVIDAVVLHQPEDVLHHRLVHDGHHGLGKQRRERPKPRAFATCHDDRLHGSP